MNCVKSLSLLALLPLLITGCASAPEGVTPVTGFEAERYLGKWYEVARLDHSFERGLENVTAEYTAREDGSIKVVNRGFDTKEQRWREVEGAAKFRGERDVAALDVTFFWPFSGGYNVIALDPEYRWSMVAGSSRDYLWLLSRKPQLPPGMYEKLTSQAREQGFPVQELIRVSHEPRP